ncbi:MAG: 1,2-phenylacetyl-CoA epoxidase subunit PaaC [Pseudomonadota bacterium]
MTDPLFDYTLRLGDDALILGQRLGEWCGHAPTLEVDLSLSNIALDLVGQATHFLEYAAELEDAGRDADRLAFHRDALAFRNCLLVEQPNGDFGRTMARQLLFSLHQKLLFEALAGSTDERLAGIAAKAVKEVRYHADLAAEWVIRLGDGTEESHNRMLEGFEWHWRFVQELFDMDELEAGLAREGIAVDRTALRPAFDAALSAILAEACLPEPDYPRPVTGGRKGHHGEHLGHLLAVMQHLPRSYPDARW